MRMVDRKTFLTLPAGTMYYQGKPWVFGGLMIKGDTLPSDDWTYCDPIGYAPIEMEAMLEKRPSALRKFINTSYGRDGRFDDDDLFLVLEVEDLVWLRSQVHNAMWLPSHDHGPRDPS